MTQVFLVSTDTSPWTVPGDWNNASNSVELVGRGGNGGTGNNPGGNNLPSGGGGGGGAYRKRVNLSLAGTVPWRIGTSASAVTTRFGNNGTTGTNYFGAQFGGNSTAAAAGVAGVVTEETGGTPPGSSPTGFAGGAGAASANNVGGAGGGGAAGPIGAGKAGGAATGFSSGGGGGGSNGNLSTAGTIPASGFGGTGGNGTEGSGGGVAGSAGNFNGQPATTGSGGGGGGGLGPGSAIAGGIGGAAASDATTSGRFDATHGVGGGGGGGGRPSATSGLTGGPGGAGANYGGGGGGSGTTRNTGSTPGAAGAGAGGLIVINYVPSGPIAYTDTITPVSIPIGGASLADVYSQVEPAITASSLPINGQTITGVYVAITADAWSAGDKSSNITLSNSDKTAAITTAVLAGVRSTQKRLNGSAGKWYAEFRLDVLNGISVGVKGVASTITDNTSEAIYYASASGFVFQNGASKGAGSASAPSAGDVICMAWDTAAELVWFRKNNESWNNSGSNNPATGVGGKDVSLASAVDYALWASSSQTNTVSVRTELADYGFTVPSGFSSWMGEAGPIAYPETIAPSAVPIGGATITPRIGYGETLTANTLPITGADVASFYSAKYADTLTASALPIGGATLTAVFDPISILDFLRPDGDTATDGWTDQAGGASNIYQSIDETSYSDTDYVQSPDGASDLKVRLYEGSTQIVEWVHTGIGTSYVDAEQTLTAPQYAAISNFNNLFAELDDNLGNVYRFPLSNPVGSIAQPVKVRYRYKSGGLPWTPASLGSALIGWWIADTGVTTSGGNVTAVADQSGNGKTLTPSGGPVPFNAAGFNGLPAFDFVATNYALLRNTGFTGLGGGVAASVFMVGAMRAATPTYGRAVGYLDASDDYNDLGAAAFILRNTNIDQVGTFRGGYSTFTPITPDTNYRIGTIYDGVNGTVYLNNVSAASVAITNAFTAVYSHILQIGFGGGAAWDGPISEIVITNSALSSGDRALLDAYFVAKWFPPLLLDSIGTAASGAYSLRRLRAAYSGDCIRVRRASDSGFLNVGFDGNGLDTASLLSFASGTDANIVTWFDQSGNGRNITGSGPDIVISGALLTTVNGKPSPFFGAGPNLISAAALADFVSAAAHTELAVARPSSGSGPGGYSSPQMFGDNSGYWSNTFGTTGFAVENYPVNAVVAMTYPANVVTLGKYDGSTLRACLNGGTGTSVSSPNINTAAAGVLRVGMGYSSPYTGVLNEFVIFNSTLSDAECNVLGANMAAFAGVTWTSI